MFGGGSGYTVTATFENAGQLVKGNYVEVAGRPIGKVKSIELDDNAQARVKLSVGSGFDPLHEGTTAVIRASSLSGIANRYIELHPGPNSAREDRRTAARSRADKTQAPVDLDQLFNTLDPKTRKGLQEHRPGRRDPVRRQVAEGRRRRSTTSTRRSRRARAWSRELVLRPRSRSSAS